jgi:hypothetical protein
MLVTDPGAANANSYVSIEEFKSFLDTLFFEVDFQGALTEEEYEDKLERLAITSSRMIDISFVWVGEKTFAGQAMAQPRSGRNDIAQELKLATMFLMLDLGTSNVDPMIPSKIDVLGINKFKIDVIEFGFNKSTGSDSLYRRLPLRVWTLIPPSWYTIITASEQFYFTVEGF